MFLHDFSVETLVLLKREKVGGSIDVDLDIEKSDGQ